jgi:hypothetical protein
LNSTYPDPIKFPEFIDHVGKYTVDHPYPYSVAHFTFGIVGEATELKHELEAYVDWLSTEEGLDSDRNASLPLALLLELGDWIWYLVGGLNEFGPRAWGAIVVAEERSQGQEIVDVAIPATSSLKLVEPVKKFVFLKRDEKIPEIIDLMIDCLAIAFSLCQALGVPIGVALALNKQKIEERYPHG